MFTIILHWIKWLKKDLPEKTGKFYGHSTIRTSSTGNQAQDSVRVWHSVVSGFGNFSGYYPTGSLYKMVRLDENSDTSVEYKDKIGHTILSEHFLSGKKLRTYYLYDDFDRLSTVITPQGESCCAIYRTFHSQFIVWFSILLHL